MRKPLLLLSVCTLFLNCKEPKPSADNTDPYLWLEEIEGDRSLKWIEAQNEATNKVIRNQPEYEPLYERFLETFNDDDKIAYPTVVGDQVYNLWQDETNERGIWRRMPMADFIDKKNSWEVVLDLDSLSAREQKKWVFKGAEWLAPGYRYCLLTLSDGGKDESVIREFDTATGHFVNGGFEVPETKGGAGWMGPDTLLVSSDFGSGSLTPSGYPYVIKKWPRNTALESAETLYSADSTVAGVWPLTFHSEGKQYVFVNTWISAFQSELRYYKDGQLFLVDYPRDAEYHGFHNGQILLALQSDWPVNGQNFRAGSLVSLDLNKNLKGRKRCKGDL